MKCSLILFPFISAGIETRLDLPHMETGSMFFS